MSAYGFKKNAAGEIVAADLTNRDLQVAILLELRLLNKHMEEAFQTGCEIEDVEDD